MTTEPEIAFAQKLEDWHERILMRAEEFRKGLATVPKSRTCERHPELSQTLDEKASADAKQIIYSPVCPKCLAEEKEHAMRERLKNQGVPPLLRSCSLENWDPPQGHNGIGEKFVPRIREFIAIKKGFLLLLGNVGTGKTHLAVGAMRHIANAVFAKQSTLLRELRDSYRDHSDGPIQKCQNAGLFVLDEIGVSGGGRDEAAMIIDILDHRHNYHLPTIITGNCSHERLHEVLDSRMVDRINQSRFGCLVFAWESKRREARDAYFK